MKKLRGGSFNLKYGRPTGVVKAEVVSLLEKHDLDFLCVQEATDYFKALNEIAGYTYFATKQIRGGDETGILVRKTLKMTKPKFGTYGDGWVTVRGGNHAPPSFTRVTIEWLRVGSIHMPTPSVWKNGVLDAPPERKDDYLEVATKVFGFFKFSLKRSRLVAGDWNEPPTTLGKWAPGWIAKKTGAKCEATVSRAGHGRIDYPMFKNVKVINVVKDTKIAEGSDHEPVIFECIKQ